MTREELNEALRRRLAGLPPEDLEATLEYYNEMIDDRMEEGLSEPEAVDALGSMEDIVNAVLAETPLPVLVRQRIRPKAELRGWMILLLILGFPVWFPLLAAAAAILFSVFMMLWALVLSVWALDLALALGGVAGLPAAVVRLFQGTGDGLLTLGGSLVFCGLAILVFLGGIWAVRGVLQLGKLTLLGIKRSIFGKERGA